MSEISKHRDPVTHYLKIHPEFFSAVCTGVKRAELRKNDRDYRVGDTLHLLETRRGSCATTGEYINATITHIADVSEWIPGYVLLSIDLALRERAEPVVISDDQIHDYLQDQINYWRAEAMKYREMMRITDAPVVPDALEHLSSIVADPRALPRRKEWISGQQYSYVLLENVEAMVDEACRAAMLNTAKKED